MGQRPSEYPTFTRTVWLLCSGLFTIAVILGIAAAVPLWRVLPFWDQWAIVGLYQRWLEGSGTFHELLAQHNEHRIAVTRLLFLLDLELFRAANWFCTPWS